ncbi:MAG: hypothetical protein KGK11_00435 [Sphingomonadales bacterium]|nr:hypothetical protein [Sphingomonadales bacterium]
MTAVLPDGWSNRRLRFDAQLNPVKSEINLHDDDEVSFVPMDAVGELGGLRLDEIRCVDDVYNGYTYFCDDDVVVAKITPCFENGKGAHASRLHNGVAFGTTELHVIRASPNVDARFLFYVTIAHDFRSFGAAEMLGAGGQKRVPERFLKDWQTPMPAFGVQHRIAAFLDEKTAQIDGLIARKQALLERLAEKRQAIVTQAVTKGLNPAAAMKDSGIGWLGQIPAHWEVKRLRFLARLQNGINIGGEFFGTGYPFVSYSDVYQNYAVPANVTGLVESTAEDRSRYSVRRGDIFFTRTSETIEEIGIASTCQADIRDASFAGFLIRARPWKGTLVPDFSKYYFRQTGIRSYLVKEMNLVTRASLGQTLLGDLPVLLPPENEQINIGAHVDIETEKLDKICCSIGVSMKALTEYRSALITAAVTGQIEGLR